MRKGYVSVSVTSLSSSREFGSICFFDNVAILVWRKMEQATKKKNRAAPHQAADHHRTSKRERSSFIMLMLFRRPNFFL